LHRDKRHRLTYPSEHVVRFLKNLDHLDPGYALDIGCGVGRHLALLEAFGYRAFGVDSSWHAVKHAEAVMADNRERRVWRGDMGNLGEHLNREDFFDVVLAYGVFYYGTRDDMAAAIAEMHRVMRPGGHGFVKTRSIHDWRASGIPEGEPEHGMPMTFLAKDEIENVYAAFSTVTFEATATSTKGRERWNSDWLISLVK
jgi:SAM-dependent methyltransferase